MCYPFPTPSFCYFGLDGWFVLLEGGPYDSVARKSQIHMAPLPTDVVQALRIAGSAETVLGAVASALSTVDEVDNVLRSADKNAGVFDWAYIVLSVLYALEPDGLNNWPLARRALFSISRSRTGGHTRWEPAE